MFEPFDKINTALEDADPRVNNNWFLISPTSMTISLLVYLLLVKYALPKFMESRKPYTIKNVLIAYNALQVVANAYLFYLSVDIWYGNVRYNFWKCNSIDKTIAADGIKSITAIYLYFLSKYTDLLDTVFFILRKKNNQVTFLHVYHHLTTPAFTWFVLRFYPGGSFVLFMLLNTLVHVVMYGYYMLAAMGPAVQKYLWWKKYITTMQLVQFSIGLVHIVAFMLSGSDCNISKTVMAIYSLNGFLYFWLFGQFYSRSYSQSQRKGDQVNKISNVNSDNTNAMSSPPRSQNEISNGKQKVT